MVVSAEDHIYTYLTGDLGTPGLSFFGVDKSKSNRQDEEERQEKVLEVHDCSGCLQCRRILTIA